MELDNYDITKAYLYLKSYAFHENLNLFLKQRIAEFEMKNPDLQLVFEDISNVINKDGCCVSDEFNNWLDKVDYHLLPKLVERKEEHQQKEHNKFNGLFISNVRDSDKYQVSKLNYFINAPVELHIIEMLWCLFVGPVLEATMSKDSFGNRLHPSVLKHATESNDLNGQEIFKRYVDQYAQWRDQAIQVATDIAKTGDDVAILSLDLKSYFYHVDLKFERIFEAINSYYDNDEELLSLANLLTQMLEKIYKRYQLAIEPRIKQTHIECKGKNGLPIGLASSAIIANWYLSKFDTCIGNNVRPSYYGRYVDDIIMVFKRPRFDAEDPIQSFVRYYLNDALTALGGGAKYVIDVEGNALPIQKDKLILQFFDKDHSRAGLEVFKQELNERSSAFKFLPSDHIEKELDRFAYDVLYDGSANKLRSIVGLSENETGLAKYLSSHITAHRLCKLDKKDTVLPQLKQFFKGQNALQFFRLWEKLYQYAIITSNYKFAASLYSYIQNEISKIDGIMPISKKLSPITTNKLHSDLKLYNQLSLSLTVGLLDLKVFSESNVSLYAGDSAFITKKSAIDRLIQRQYEIYNFSISFRMSNLIRHHLVAWPLANFSVDNGDLTNETDFVSNAFMKIDERKIDYSPRFIHFDEWQIFHLGKYLNSKLGLNKWIQDSISEYRDRFNTQDFSASFETVSEENAATVKSHLTIQGGDTRDNLILAIANLVVNEEDICSAIRKDSSPNLSFSRQEKLYSILNTALKEKADLLVMPEVAIPVSWLPFMVSFSRRNQVGLIFGLEHWVIGDVAYNLVVEALPFKVSGKYKSCVVTARIKNHYAPAELDLLESIRLKAGNLSFKPKSFYHRVSWRGVSFATYNCFELSDITHRVLFKSEIDLLFACVWNKDTNYYKHILESTVRDLHCDTVHANTSQYGGSCVLRPTKTESKTMLYVKGGDNSCVLTTSLDIKSLRAFQYKSKPDTKDIFKHLPPGYNSEHVLDR